MANNEDFARIWQGPAVWNEWRAQNPGHRVDLGGHFTDRHRYGANLYGADLRGFNLSGVNLSMAILGEANLSGVNLAGSMLAGANLPRANLSGANLTGAGFHQAYLGEANLSGANISGADLSEVFLCRANLSKANLSRSNLILANLSTACLAGADLTGANFDSVYLSSADLVGAHLSKANLAGACLSGANLSGANLTRAHLGEARLTNANLTSATLAGADLNSALLTEANLTDADLTGCRVYGISAWNLQLEGAKQRDLVITGPNEPEITVDNLEVAQFIYLLLHHKKIRDAIDTIGKKGVLLLGRFSDGRLAVLERLRTELRERDFVPIVFNFDKPETKTFTETVRLLAGFSRFVIADITNPRSAPLELQATVPECMIPFVTIVENGEEPFSMFEDLWKQHGAWVLDPLRYGSVEELAQKLDEKIIRPALAKFDELVMKKAEKLRYRD